MKRKMFKHTIAIALIMVFVALALGSAGSSPSSYSSSGSSGAVTYTFSNQSRYTVEVDIESSSYTIPPGSTRTHRSNNWVAVTYYYSPYDLVQPFTSDGFYIVFRNK